MPDREGILLQLAQLALDARGVALAWHVLTLVGLLGFLATRWRPRASIGALASAGPVASASLLAFGSGNPFNGTVLGLAVIALSAFAARAPPVRLGTGRRPWTSVVGAAVVAYALVYPHFIEIRSWVDLWFAPTGVLPCPSLALTLGLGLLGGGFASRAWALTGATAGAFYALFGMFRLGVWLDAGLLAAAAALAVQGSAIRHDP